MIDKILKDVMDALRPEFQRRDDEMKKRLDSIDAHLSNIESALKKG